MPSPNSPQSRRTFLKRGSATVAGTAVAGGLPAFVLGADAALGQAAAANPIVAENTTTPVSTHTDAYRVSNISSVTSGFAKRASVNAGEPVELAISGPNLWLPGAGQGDPVETANVEVYRLGYYGGRGSRLVWQTAEAVSTWQRVNQDGEPDNGAPWPADHPVDANTGLTGFGNYRTIVTVPGSALTVSGVYLAKIKGNWLEFPPGVPAIERSGESHAVFIVRDDARPRDVLALLPSNTWQAYNYFTGRSLYTYSSRYTSTTTVPATGTERAAKVSLDRPYNNWMAQQNWVLHTEFPAIYWMEKQGYDVSYTEDVALHFDPAQALPENSKSLAILGHGEYWTKEQRNAVDAARDAGTHIYNFGANTAYWSVRYEQRNGAPATNQDNARVLVCYKTIEGGGTDAPTVSSQADPVSPTTTWRDPGKGPGINPPGTTAATPSTYAGNDRAETELFGVWYFGDDDHELRGLTVPAADGDEFAGHRAWRHTSVPASGAQLGTSLMGWEWDGVPAATQPFYKPPVTKAGSGELKRLSQTDPRTSGSSSGLAWMIDGGRKYTGGPGAGPPDGWVTAAHAVTYTAPSGALVFSAGTLRWSWGLGPHHVDNYNNTHADPPIDVSQLEIQQATANLFVDGGIRPATPDPQLVIDPPDDPDPVDTTAPAFTLRVLNRGMVTTIVPASTRKVSILVTVDASEQSGPVSVLANLGDSRGLLGTTTASITPGFSRGVEVVIPVDKFQRVQSAWLFGLSATMFVKVTDTKGNARTWSAKYRLRAG